MYQLFDKIRETEVGLCVCLCVWLWTESLQNETYWLAEFFLHSFYTKFVDFY